MMQQHVTAVLSWPQTFCGSKLLKKRVRSPYNRTKASPPTLLPPHLPLLQGTVCPQWPSFKAFLATECTFAHCGPIGHFLCISLRTKATFCHLLGHLQKEQESHTQSSEGRLAANAKIQRCFLVVDVGQCGINAGAVKYQGSALLTSPLVKEEPLRPGGP